MADKRKVIEFHSEHSETVIYACGYCGFAKLSREHAEKCCICNGCGITTDARHDWCDTCQSEAYAAREAARCARDWELPVVEDKGEPVLAGDKFYEDVDAAAEAIWDDGRDPTTVIAHPCTVGRADTPLIQEWVEEHWYTQFEDPDESTTEMSKVAAEACAALQTLLESEAPISWIPRTKERVLLQAIDESKVVHLHE